MVLYRCSAVLNFHLVIEIELFLNLDHALSPPEFPGCIRGIQCVHVNWLSCVVSGIQSKMVTGGSSISVKIRICRPETLPKRSGFFFVVYHAYDRAPMLHLLPEKVVLMQCTKECHWPSSGHEQFQSPITATLRLSKQHVSLSRAHPRALTSTNQRRKGKARKVYKNSAKKG